MIRFLAEHCFDEDILRGVIRRSATVEFVCARDVGLATAQDPEILRWAAEAARVTITHDRNTMIAFAIKRIRNQEPMSGLVVVDQLAPLALVIEDVLLLGECTETSEWRDRIEFIPL